MVEYIGMRNLINAMKENVALRNGKVIFGLEGMMHTGLNFEVGSKICSYVV